MTEFSSAFGQRISNFLDYRTARNFKKETYLRHFIKFDDWCMNKHPEEFLLSRELETGEILITHTKRNKERFVVMSNDMLDFARKYDLRRKVFGCGNPYFFPSASGGAMTTEMVYSTFNRAW